MSNTCRQKSKWKFQCFDFYVIYNQKRMKILHIGLMIGDNLNLRFHYESGE